MTVITRDHQVEIGSSLVVCSRTEPVRRGSVENRDRRGRYGCRYARAARRFAGGENSGFPVSAGGSTRNLHVRKSFFRLFCLIPRRKIASSEYGGISMLNSQVTFFSHLKS